MTRLRERFDAVFGDLPRTYWLLIAGMFVNRVGAFVLPFLSLYLVDQEHLSTGEAGLVLSAWGIGSLAAAVLGGQLADRWGRKPTMLLSLCGGGGVLGALAAVHGVVALAVAGCALGAVAELYRPAVTAAITDVVRPDQRARAFAHLSWSFNVAFAISPLVAGLLVAHAGYAWLFVGDAATMLLAALLIAVAVHETKPNLARVAVGEPKTSTLRLILNDGRLAALLVAAFLLGLIIIQVPAVLAHVMKEDGIDAEGFGRIVALNGLLIVLTQPWVVPLFERLGRMRVLPCAALLFGAGFATHAVADGALGHALAIALWTSGEVALFPLCNALVADISPERFRGRCQGAYWMAWAAAYVVGPSLGLAVLDSSGVHGWGLGIAGIGLAATAALVVVGVRVTRHADHAAS